MVFAGIGFAVSMICGIFEMYQWTSWFTNVIDDTKTMGYEFDRILIFCFINSALLYLFQMARASIGLFVLVQRHRTSD